ncbi:universal stress protein [Nocardia sp. alder85J]|uniref:universal stress protein n=1 Tax=Nocardia sp. alder85J TaxID=2862949 RepID=UPI001CD5FFE9|nr:universal stress protein [Nocardia sp. alder85J]MCX4093807.1 universal stress protein [Nocardia sp. alder85J]
MATYDVPQEQRLSPRIVVGVSGSLDSLAALHRAVAEARRRPAADMAEVVAVLAWQPPGGEYAQSRYPCPELLDAARSEARRRLLAALDDAFAGIDPGVPLRAELVRGDITEALLACADRSEDLLVVGSGGGWLRRCLRRRVAARLLRRAACPVLVVPKPELQRELERAGSWLPGWLSFAKRPAPLLPEAAARPVGTV